MSKAYTAASFSEELAAFLASRPTRAQMLAYRPSQHAQERARALLERQNEGPLSHEEQQELEEFAHAERLIRLIKAMVRSPQTSRK
jgi:hypothetical protein